MAITWRRVPEVPAGSTVSRRDAAALFGGINERVLSGLGDAAWRYVFWWVSAARQIRNPDETQTLFPPANEFFHLFQHMRPDQEWSVTGPGDPEGPNLASLMPAFVAGAEAIHLDPEDVRLSDPEVGVPVEDAATAEELWELGKRQRGAWDPGTGLMASPSFRAAAAHFSLVPSPSSPHGNSYGGFFPTPELLGDCADGTSDTPPSPDYQIQFTNLTTGSLRTYPGTCPDNPDAVNRVIPWPLGYYVVLNSGQVDYLPRSQWIEGPYSGGNRLSKAYGEHVPRFLNRFAGEFQGGAERHARELAGKAEPFAKAFQIRRFFLSQYLLAPAYGMELGEETVYAQYPTRNLAGATSASPGTRIGTSVTIHGGFVVAAVFVKSDRLVGSATVELRQGETVVARATVSDAAPAVISVLRNPAAGELQWVLTSGARWYDSAGSLTVEIAELMEYRPGNHDLMLICRLGGARAASLDGTDGSGLSEVDAKEIWKSYAAYGCVAKRREDQYLPGDDALGKNAVFDLFRRWAKDTVRIMPRQQLIGYAVEDGKSVLWFSPFPNGLSGSNRVDSFAGIRDEIAREAPKKWWSNRWVFFPEFFRYKDSESSIWKPSVLADWASFSDRCVHWTSTLRPINKQLQRHFNLSSSYDAKMSYAPEVATGYRYALGLNSSATEDFYRSCRVYEPPLEVENAETVIEDGVEVVKVTLTGRLHHHHALAPASIDRDVTTWVRADLTAEAASYRTPENALREYILHTADNTYQCEKSGPGNAASNSDILSYPGVPWGACYPQLFFVRLMPEPYADGNDRPDPSDTVMTHEQMGQAELWLRVMSEGYVDGSTTAQYGCTTGIDAVFDFRWETLCVQANGIPWITSLPTHTTESLGEDEIREDHPAGYGPLPTTITTAEVWNQYARILNLMNRVRVMLPFKFQTRLLRDFTTRISGGVTYSDGSPAACPGGSLTGFVYRGNPGDVEATTEILPWDDNVSGYSRVDAGLSLDGTGSAYDCSGSLWVVYAQREETEYRWSLVDPDAQYAMPESWRGMLDTDGEMLAIVQTDAERVGKVGYGTPTTCNGVEYWTDAGGHIEYGQTTDTVIDCSIQPAAAKVHAPAIGQTFFIGASGTPICNELAESTVTTLRTLYPVPTDALILRVPLTDGEAAT